MAAVRSGVTRNWPIRSAASTLGRAVGSGFEAEIKVTTVDTLLAPNTLLAAVTVAVLITLPVAAGSIATTRVKAADEPLVRVAISQLTGPVPPEEGVVQLKAGPLSWLKDTNVVLAGT